MHVYHIYIYLQTVKVYWPADNQVVKHGVFKVGCKDSKTTAHYVSKILSITYHGPVSISRVYYLL